MKIRVGILIFGDPTRGGAINSEVKFLQNLYEINKEDCEFVILTVNPTITKRVIRRSEIYNFPYKLVTVFEEKDFGVLDTLSCLVTYHGHSNFFGGYLNDNVIKMYKIVSKCTNELKIPVFVRINDSEIKIRDYRLMCEIRLNREPDSVFMANPVNVKKAHDLVSWKKWDYTRVYWFANGSKEVCDWVVETIYDRENEKYRCHSNRQIFIDNAIYVSDDIFFSIRKNYEKFSYLKFKPYTDNRICYIGFFDTVNTRRAIAFKNIYKKNLYKVPMKIFGKGTEILKKIANLPNLDIEEGFIRGDSDEYFEWLHKHLAYIFVGKGQSESHYIGKTVYDAVVARTPVIVYEPCDEKHIVFDNSEFYFRNEYELKQIYDKLQDKEIRNRWIEEQANEIFSKLPKSSFRFSSFCNPTLVDLPKEKIYLEKSLSNIQQEKNIKESKLFELFS